MGVLVGIWAAVHFSRLLALLLDFRGEHAILIAFFIVFLATLLLANLLGRTADRVIRALKMNLPNKILGAALGLVKSVCILSVILSGIVLIDTNKTLISQETRDKSLLYSPILSTGDELISSLKEYIDEHPDLTEKIIEASDKTSEKVDKKTLELEQKKGMNKSNKTEKKGGKK